MYIDPKHRRTAGRFDFGQYKPFTAVKSDRKAASNVAPR